MTEIVKARSAASLDGNRRKIPSSICRKALQVVVGCLIAVVALLPLSSHAATTASVSFDANGGSKSVKIYSETQGRWTFSGQPSSSASWVSASTGVESPYWNILVIAKANTGAARTATITFVGSGVTYTIYVSQSGTGGTTKPDLAFYKPSSWPAAMYLSSSSSGSSQTSFAAGSTVYVNYAWRISNAAVSSSYSIMMELCNSSGKVVWSNTTSVTAGSVNTTYSGQPSVNLSSSMSGTYTMRVTLDSRGNIAESNEGNNTTSVTFSVTKSATKPDLAFYKPSSWPAAMYLSSSAGGSSQTSFAAGSTVYVNYAWRISNAAVSSSYSIMMQLYDASGKVVWSNTTSVTAGSVNTTYSGQPSVNFSSSMSGAYTMKVTLDSRGNIAESNEGNNSSSVSFSLTGGSGLFPVYRFYSKKYSGHFYTIDATEWADLRNTNPNWNYEGIAYYAYKTKASGTVPLYRFYSKKYKGHFYTTDSAEMQSLKSSNPNWSYENIAYYVRSSSASGTTPIYRFWSKRYRHHFYTKDYDEMMTLRTSNPNWSYEGTGFYAWSTKSVSSAKASALVTTEEGNPDAMGEAHGEGEGTVTESVWPLEACANALTGNDGEWEWVDVAAPGVTEVGGMSIETRLDVPDTEELDGPLGGIRETENSVLLSLALPEGEWSATVWNAVDGTVWDEDLEGSFDFDLSIPGLWHWLCVRDADGEIAQSVWIRAE